MSYPSQPPYTKSDLKDLNILIHLATFVNNKLYKLQRNLEHCTNLNKLDQLKLSTKLLYLRIAICYLFDHEGYYFGWWHGYSPSTAD